jgi:polar amino acid transport system substrate-binding protein
VGQQMLVRNEDARKYSALTLPVTRARIGVEKGTTSDQFVQEQCRIAEAVPFKDPKDAAKALIKGKVDLVLHDAPVVWWLASEYEADGLTGIFTPLTDESLAWAIRPADRDLLAEVNTFLSVIQEDGSLDETILKWAPFAR